MPQAAPLIGQIALNLAIGVGASVLSSVLRPQQSSYSAQTSRGISFEVAVGEQVAVSAVFGRGRAKGHLVFAQEYGPNNEYAKFVYAMGKGWWDACETLLLDEEVVGLSGSNADTHGRVITDRVVEGEPYGWWKTYTGAPGQAADAGLIAAAPSRWTSAHTGVGTPYGVLTIRQNPDVWGNTLPRLGSVWRGLRQYDWRFDDTMPGGEGDMRWADPSTWEWSQNPAVLKWAFRRGVWVNGVKVLGLGFSRHAQDVAYYTAAANLSDEEMDWGPRYAFGREISDDESPLEVLREFDRSMCGTSFDRGGADAPLPAQQHVSVMTLEDHHRIEFAPVIQDRWGTVSAKRTAYHGQFVDATEAWASRPYPVQVDTDLETLIGGRKLEPFDQPFEAVSERAQMRAQIMLRRNLFGATRTETFGPRSNVLELGDVITRPMAEASWGTMLCEITRIEPLADRLGNRISWQQWSNSIVPDDTGFVALPAGPGAGPAAADRTTAVSGLDVSAYGRSSGGAVLPYLKVSWTPITDPNVEQVVIRLWPSAGTEANDAETFAADPRLTSLRLCGPLAPLTEFTGYAIPVRKDGRTCVPTTLFVRTTGELTTPAEVADGSLSPEKLGQELLNRVYATVDQITGRMADFETQLGDLAQTVAEHETEQLETVTGLSLRSEAASASVLRLEEVVLSPTGAFAQFTQSVNARINEVSANGFFRATADVTPETGTVLVSLGVKATNGEWTSIAALELGAEATVDGAESFINMMADRLGILSTAGAYVAKPFAVGTINGSPAVKITTLYFDDLFSTAEAEPGEPVIKMLGATGDFTIEYPS